MISKLEIISILNEVKLKYILSNNNIDYKLLIEDKELKIEIEEVIYDNRSILNANIDGTIKEKVSKLLSEANDKLPDFVVEYYFMSYVDKCREIKELNESNSEQSLIDKAYNEKYSLLDKISKFNSREGKVVY